MYRVRARLVPVGVFSGSRNGETEGGSVRQGLNVSKKILQQWLRGMSNQYVRLLGASECALFLVCFCHSRSSVGVHLSVD